MDFDRCQVLKSNLVKAVNNSTNRIRILSEAEKDENDLIEIIMESVIQTHEIAIELAWKTVKCYALRIEPSGRVSGSTTAIKLGLSTGIIRRESLSRTLLEAIQHRNMSSHEYLIIEGLDDYVNRIRYEFNPALQELIADLEEL